MQPEPMGLLFFNLVPLFIMPTRTTSEKGNVKVRWRISSDTLPTKNDAFD